MTCACMHESCVRARSMSECVCVVTSRIVMLWLAAELIDEPVLSGCHEVNIYCTCVCATLYPTNLHD